MRMALMRKERKIWKSFKNYIVLKLILRILKSLKSSVEDHMQKFILFDKASLVHQHNFLLLKYWKRNPCMIRSYFITHSKKEMSYLELITRSWFHSTMPFSHPREYFLSLTMLMEVSFSLICVKKFDCLKKILEYMRLSWF